MYAILSVCASTAPADEQEGQRRERERGASHVLKLRFVCIRRLSYSSRETGRFPCSARPALSGTATPSCRIAGPDVQPTRQVRLHPAHPEVELPARDRLVEAVGVVETDRPERRHELEADARAAVEPGRVDLARIPPHVSGVVEEGDPSRSGR